MSETPCSICKEQGHHPLKCPELCDPLRPGFSGASGGGGHGGDDDEDRLLTTYILRRNPSCTLVSEIQIDKQSQFQL